MSILSEAVEKTTQTFWCILEALDRKKDVCLDRCEVKVDRRDWLPSGSHQLGN